MSTAERKSRFQRNLFIITFILSLLNGFMIIAGASAITAMEDDGLDRAWIEEHIARWHTLVKIEGGLLGIMAILFGLRVINWVKKILKRS